MTAKGESLPGHAQIVEAIERFEGRPVGHGSDMEAAVLVGLMRRFNPRRGYGVPTYIYRGNYYQAREGRLVRGPIIDLGNGEGT